MAYVQQDNRFMKVMKIIWPPINKVVNAVFYFLVSLVKSFFKVAFQMIKGK